MDSLNLMMVAAGMIGLLVAYVAMTLRARQGHPVTAAVRLGAFGLAALLVVAGLFAGISGLQAGAPAPAAAKGVLQQQTATQDSAPQATATRIPATSLPTLTPAPSETDIVLVTPIIYQYANPTTTTNCNATASTAINLRGDPSQNNGAVGKVFAGSVMPVMGRSEDKQWWYVKATLDNQALSTSVDGWVSAQFVKVDKTCDQNAIPVVGPNGAVQSQPQTSTSVPTATALPKPSATATASPVPPTAKAATSAATDASTAAATEAASTDKSTQAATGSGVTCSVLTTIASSIRPDPSRQRPPVAQVAERVALEADAKTANIQWYHVNYAIGGNSGSGWIGAGAVLPSSNCAKLPVVTPTAG